MGRYFLCLLMAMGPLACMLSPTVASSEEISHEVLVSCVLDKQAEGDVRNTSVLARECRAGSSYQNETIYKMRHHIGFVSCVEFQEITKEAINSNGGIPAYTTRPYSECKKLYIANPDILSDELMGMYLAEYKDCLAATQDAENKLEALKVLAECQSGFWQSLENNKAIRGHVRPLAFKLLGKLKRPSLD